MRSLALAALAALAPAVSVSAESDTKTLIYLLSSDVDSLDPAWAYDATSLFAIGQVYENLVDFEGAAVDRFVPRLATVVPTLQNGFLSKDGLSYAFPLRRGVTFHDGSALTAQDVKYSLLRFLLTDREGGPSSLLLRPLLGRGSVLGADGRPDPAVYDLADKAVSVEGGALVLRLSRPFAPLLSVLAGGFAPVVSKAYVAANGGWDGKKETWTRFWNPAKQSATLHARADGTGPFKLESWDAAAKRLVLTRNETYWRSPATLASVRLETVEDARERHRLMGRGEADAAQIEPRWRASYQSLPDTTVDDLPQLQADNVILFNLAAQPRDNPWLGSGRLDGQGVPPDFFADADVRRAFAFSFDHDAFIRDGFQGKAEPSRGPIPGGLPGYDPRRPGRPFSLEEAAKAFRAARGGEVWAKGFLLPVAYPEGGGERRLACQILASNLAQVNPGFRVDCRGLPQSRLLDELRARRLGAFVYRWILDYPDSHNAVEPFLHSSGFFARFLGYSNPRADAAIERAAAETDPAKRRDLYAELQALALSDAPQVYTADAPGAFARRAKIQNWTHNPILPFGTLYEVNKLP